MLECVMLMIPDTCLIPKLDIEKERIYRHTKKTHKKGALFTKRASNYANTMSME